MTDRAVRLSRIRVALLVMSIGACAALPSFASDEMMDAPWYSQILLDRVEYADGGEGAALQWGARAWLGGDYRRLWLKSEGSGAGHGRARHADVQLLYGALLSQYWDVQAGIRYEQVSTAARSYAVLGLHGLAPYWFEVDAAAFIGERGAFSARLEAEQDWLITQRLILQPRLETTFAACGDADTGVSHGIGKVDIELRLRYEIVREFAPYLGVVWEHGSYAAGDLDKGGGGAISLVAGIRAWF